VPIIICSGSSAQRDVVVGLKLGADDFITKPFDAQDLEARVQAVLRRTRRATATTATTATTAATATATAAETTQVGALRIDPTRCSAEVAGRDLRLTAIEYKLLTALALRTGRVVSRNDLAGSVWGYSDASVTRTMDAHLCRLRAKLGGAAAEAPALVNVRGFGFKLTAK
jgi:DNA-binding response OmpR family regulator